MCVSTRGWCVCVSIEGVVCVCVSTRGWCVYVCVSIEGVVCVSMGSI